MLLAKLSLISAAMLRGLQRPTLAGAITPYAAGGLYKTRAPEIFHLISPSLNVLVEQPDGMETVSALKQIRCHRPQSATHQA